MTKKEFTGLKEFLSRYKEENNLNSADLARLFGVSPGTISHWLSGYSRPSFKASLRIVYKTKGKIRPEDLGY